MSEPQWLGIEPDEGESEELDYTLTAPPETSFAFILTASSAGSAIVVEKPIRTAKTYTQR